LPKNINKLLIATIDLETIELNNNQIPISISFSYYLNDQLITIFELINYNLLLENPDQAVKLLWLNFMNRINDLNLHKCIIFSHNLGSFDGYFIFKGLLELPGVNIDKVNSIIDDLHRFISIDLVWKDTKFIFKDSLRIFPISLRELCTIFEVEGKLFPYKSDFNKITIFENIELLNQFIDYSKQDSICLLKALIKAQDIYIEEHQVDIATIWSTSTLSFKIFRQKFLEMNIPTLSKTLDSLIRLAYIGGSSDYYLKYGENLKHYDVNSLYPKAMCNPMPIEFLGETDWSTANLENIFGFAEAKITTPENMEIPLLPFKLFNETLHPLGSWIGIYFSEELKAITKYGYKVELIKVYNFSKATIFDKYIEYFYNIKKFASGALRDISKMHLNTLYGYFGRSKTLIETKNVYTKDLNKYYGSYAIFSEIKINSDISTILMSSNLNYELINEIKEETTLDLITSFRNVKSHVGIAAAVTSYARIEMMELKMLLVKLGIKLYYTDTDSFFVDKELPAYLIGKDLGQLKDELKGGWISKGYFLGVKKYGYLDDNNKTHSIFSGVARNSLNWNEIEQIENGITIVKPSPARFFKNISKQNKTKQNKTKQNKTIYKLL
jgi:DNA polymerase type B, organellar and viral